MYSVFNMFFPHRSASTLSFMYTTIVHKIVTKKFNGVLGGLLLYSCLELLYCHSGCCYLKCCLWPGWYLWYLQIYREFYHVPEHRKYELQCVVCVLCACFIAGTSCLVTVNRVAGMDTDLLITSYYTTSNGLSLLMKFCWT